MASRKFGKAIWELLLHIVVHSFDERSQSDAADSSTMTRVTSFFRQLCDSGIFLYSPKLFT